MFRLEERQIHILIGLLCGASLVLFCLFGIVKLPKTHQYGTLDGLTDFSEGWIAAYETEDEEKLKQYYSTQEDRGDSENRRITEVVNFPAELPVQKGQAVTLTHKVPDTDKDTIYLTLWTHNQSLRVYVEQDLIYSSDKAERKLPVYHVVPIDSQYKNMGLTVELTGYGNNPIEIDKIRVGSFTEVMVDAFAENGAFFITGLLLLCVSICMLVVWFLAQNTWKQKKLLLYCSLEGVLAGFLFLSESLVLQVLAGWSYGICFLQTCLIVVEAVVHLMVIRCFVYKKKVLSLVDMGIAFYGIFYISVMVLQAFSLLRFDDIYFAGKLLFFIGVILYTVVLGVVIYEYGRNEGKPVFYANAILLGSLLVMSIMRFSGGQENADEIYLPFGIFVYMVFVWIYALKQVFYVEPEKSEAGSSDKAVREQIVEQINPNLLFASFAALQNLIRSGSDNSVKMIYYISVYLRDNLKSVNQAGEMISFEEELEHMLAYLQLQKTRNQQLGFTMECKVKDFKVPRHSIEPIVENAVKHGIANKGNKGNVVIRTYRREEGYAIQVIDDGVGFDQKTLVRKSPTALLNLFATLEKACQAKIEVISKEGKGTVITIVLPMLENDLIE